MKLVSQKVTIGQSLMTSKGSMSTGVVPMGSAIDHAVLSTAADHFHNIDFATFGPTHGRNGRAHRPERRPQALTFWNERPDVDPSILKALLALCRQARRGIKLVANASLFCVNDQVTILNGCILFRIKLQLVIAPAAAPGFIIPVARVEVVAVKFILPGQGHPGVVIRRGVSGSGYGRFVDLNSNANCFVNGNIIDGGGKDFSAVGSGRRVRVRCGSICRGGRVICPFAEIKAKVYSLIAGGVEGNQTRAVD